MGLIIPVHPKGKHCESTQPLDKFQPKGYVSDVVLSTAEPFDTLICPGQVQPLQTASLPKFPRFFYPVLIF